MSRTLHSVKSDCEWKLWATCNNNSTAEYHYVLRITPKTILYVSIIFITVSLFSVSRTYNFWKDSVKPNARNCFQGQPLTFLSMLRLLPWWNWSVTKSSISVWKKVTPLQRSGTIPNHQLSCPLTVSVCSSTSVSYTDSHSRSWQCSAGIMRGCGKESRGGVSEKEPSREDTHTESGGGKHLSWPYHKHSIGCRPDTKTSPYCSAYWRTHTCMCKAELCRQEVS